MYAGQGKMTSEKEINFDRCEVRKQKTEKNRKHIKKLFMCLEKKHII